MSSIMEVAFCSGQIATLNRGQLHALVKQLRCPACKDLSAALSAS